MFVVFEGIDGSGKTTVSSRVAKALRKRGTAVEHFREGGTFASALVTRLREFGKDPRNLVMEPLPELLFYLAREAQLLAECVAPALAKGGLVFADRYLDSFSVLAEHARGLDPATIRPIVDAVAGGVWPELVVLLDVDPHLARARRRVSKIAQAGDEEATGGSRKGLAGIGMQHRIRAGYLAAAARAPARWLVVDNGDEQVQLDEVVDRVTDAVAALWQGTAAADVITRAIRPARPRPPAPAESIDGALDELHRRLGPRREREPAVVAYFLAGLRDPRSTGLLEELAASAPHVVAQGLRGRDEPWAWSMRERLLEVAPYWVARSVDGLLVVGERADAMRRRLFAREPRAVLATLDGSDGALAWELREQAWAAHPGEVVASLQRLGSERSWRWRDEYLAARPAGFADPVVARPLIASLRGLGDERAWVLRRAGFDAVPVTALDSLIEVGDDESWRWRERHVARAAKVVFRTIDGVDEPRAWALRERFAATVKEVFDSMTGLDGEQAFGLREASADTWPSTVAKSLGPLAATARGGALLERLLRGHWDNLSLLKHAARLGHDPSAVDLSTDG